MESKLTGNQKYMSEKFKKEEVEETKSAVTAESSKSAEKIVTLLS